MGLKALFQQVLIGIYSTVLTNIRQYIIILANKYNYKSLWVGLRLPPGGSRENDVI